MAKLILIVCMFVLGGCATWDAKSDTEKQAWIFSGAIIVAAAFLSEQEDKTIISTAVPQDICFESTCEL